MLRVTRSALALGFILCACARDGGHSPATRVLDPDRSGAQQTQSAPVSSADGGGPVNAFNTLILNATGTRPNDAGLGGLDAGSGTDGALGAHDAGSDAASYACERNSDCQIKNIFSCCGYFPRCANTTANFSPPDCSQGQVGVCSLPLIDHCECRQKACVDVQGVTAN